MEVGAPSELCELVNSAPTRPLLARSALWCQFVKYLTQLDLGVCRQQKRHQPLGPKIAKNISPVLCVSGLMSPKPERQKYVDGSTVLGPSEYQNTPAETVFWYENSKGLTTIQAPAKISPRPKDSRPLATIRPRPNDSRALIMINPRP